MGDTLTFGNGVELVTDFLATELDTLNVNTASTLPTALLNLDFTGAGTNGTSYLVYGSFSNGVFTAAAVFDATTNNDALLVTSNGSVAFNAHSGWTVIANLQTALVAGDFN